MKELIKMHMKNPLWEKNPKKAKEQFVAEIKALLFDKEHLENCASCKVGIFCNAPVIGKAILGLTKQEAFDIINELTGKAYGAKEQEKKDYEEYCEAKREINEEPLTFYEWMDFNKSASEDQ